MKLFNFRLKNKKSEHKDLGASELIKKKITAAVQVCKNDITTERNKIYEIKTLTKKLIADVYFVPSEYWYDELKFINEIKNHPENKTINASVQDKIDKLLEEYTQQIKLCESKIDFLNSLLLKYEALSDKAEKIIHKTLMLKTKDEYVKALKKYKKKLNTFTESTEDLSTIYEESENLKSVRNEISETENDFLIQQEVNEYMNKITSEFNEADDSANTELLRKEIKKLKEEINKTKNQ